PAVGQGAIAIETRADNEFAIEVTGALDHEQTRLCCLAERAFLRHLGGGCQFPIAGHAEIDKLLILDGLVASPNGENILRGTTAGDPESAEQIGSELASELIEHGANSLLNP
ncbi:MAG TPA: hypothetical protein VFS77_10830, partial [Pyrinomonadaceae bacterium]|nr:hypothetical protein [Pyrinomonadaceae bacterium]